MRYFVWLSTFAIVILQFIFIDEKTETKPHQHTYYGFDNSKSAPWQNEKEVDIYRQRVYSGPIDSNTRILHEQLVCY